MITFSNVKQAFFFTWFSTKKRQIFFKRTFFLSKNEIDAKELVNAIEQTLGKDVKILVNTLSEYNTHFTSAKTLFIAFHKKVD